MFFRDSTYANRCTCVLVSARVSPLHTSHQVQIFYILYYSNSIDHFFQPLDYYVHSQNMLNNFGLDVQQYDVTSQIHALFYSVKAPYCILPQYCLPKKHDWIREFFFLLVVINSFLTTKNIDRSTAAIMRRLSQQGKTQVFMPCF